VIVLDTHAWIWLRSDPDRVPPVSRELVGREEAALSAISCWELATLVRLGRVSLDRDPGAWVSQALDADPPVRAVPLGHDVALTAGMLDDPFPGDPADRIIFATTRSLGARLVTKDRRLREFAPAETVWD
jgi:PIN domain nuclease of toxin-antitoxin system